MVKINKCFLLIQNNRFNEAIKIIEQSGLAIQQDTKSTLMGIIESKQNNYSHSIKHFKNALNLCPKNISYNFNLGIAFGRNLNTAMSIGQLKICIRNNYKAIECLLDISKQLTNKNKLNLALKILLNYKQKNDQIFYNISFIYNKIDKIILAKKNILESLKINSQNIPILKAYPELLEQLISYQPQNLLNREQDHHQDEANRDRQKSQSAQPPYRALLKLICGLLLHFLFRMPA